MFEKQKQEAGDNSLQIQAGTLIMGITEKRAREIFDEKLPEVIKGYSQEAYVTAERRMQAFANDLIPKLVKASLLDALKEPAIQILLLEAQKSAASTERVADYSLLSELLIHRVEKGADRNVQAAVNRAVEIVDDISDEALLGLTVAHSVSYFFPSTGNIEDGIKILVNLFEKIMYSELPVGDAWLDHLDTLNAIRMNNFGSLKKINQWYPERFPGYVEVGIKKDSEGFQKATIMVREAGLPADILYDHELRPGYARLRMLSIDRLDFISIHSYHTDNSNGQLVTLPIQQQLSEAQKQTIRNIHALYSNESHLRDENINQIMKLWDEQHSLKKLREWWDSIPQPFNITAVGRVLAHANAQRCDSTLPPLD